METSRNEWIETFSALRETEQCEVAFHENPCGEALPDYHTLTAILPYRQRKIRVMQTAQQIAERILPGSLSCTLYDPKLHFKLYLIVRSWFDTLMSQSFCTGNARFDEIFIVKSNCPPIARELFRDPRVQEMFLTRTRILNCSACSSGTYITFKSTESRLYTPREIVALLADFQYMLHFIYAPQEQLSDA